MPCCSGPITLTSRRSGAVTISSAARKDVNSPTVSPLSSTSLIAMYMTAARPNEASICTTGFDTALTVMSFM